MFCFNSNLSSSGCSLLIFINKELAGEGGGGVLACDLFDTFALCTCRPCL